MKSFIACVLLLTLVGAGLCSRHRRQAPADVPAPGAPADAPAAGPPEDVPAVPEVDGLQLAIDSEEAKPEPDAVKVNTLKFIQKYLNDQKATGMAAAAPPAA